VLGAETEINIMKIHFLGGVGTVTGAKYLLETKKAKILVDCGMIQGSREDEEKNYEDFPFNPSEIDFLLITHAHIDHTGLIPKLYKDGFRGKIIATPPTLDLVRLMLYDSQNIIQRNAFKQGKQPFYFRKDVEESLKLVETLEYRKKKKLIDEVYLTFQDAGHILGSCIIEIYAEGKKIVFSGDLGNAPMPLLNEPAKITKADYIVTESTYGDRVHENTIARKEALENVIENTFNKKGVLMIPSLAIERTQELLYELNDLVENDRIPDMPIFIDSPMAIEATGIYKKHSKYFNLKATNLIKTGDDLFNFPGLTLTKTVVQSKSINKVAAPKIIIAGSGMSTGGRILFHEKMYLPEPNNTLLLINFQVKGTLGRIISEGVKNIRIFNEPVSVRANIKSIEGYSSHADQTALYKWLANFSKPVKNIFTVHGEKEASKALIQKIKDHLGLPASLPKPGDVVEL